MAFDQAKMLMQAKKLQKEMAKQLIEAEAGDGAVIVTVNGEMKVKKVKINPEMVDTNNIEQLEKWIEDALRGATNAAQEYAAEKMKPIMGNLGGMGF
jgi:DNA-binding YbaB/EbfC family protein